MLEVEVKIQLDSPQLASLRERLGASADGPPTLHQQRDIYFSHPDRDFKARDEALRLRVDAGVAITWKGPKLDPPLKTREEIEFGLETDPDTAIRFLRALGYSEVGTVSKKREQWQLQSPHPASVCLDQVEQLGSFVEVEVTAKQVATGRSLLESVLRSLDLDAHPFIQTSYLGMLVNSAH